MFFTRLVFLTFILTRGGRHRDRRFFYGRWGARLGLFRPTRFRSPRSRSPAALLARWAGALYRVLVTLYHLTSPDRLDAILREGLRASEALAGNEIRVRPTQPVICRLRRKAR